MKYFIVEGTFKNPLPVKPEELKEAIGQHMAYLDTGFEKGFILVSGPKPQRNGGFVVMKAESLQEAEAFFSKDPLFVTGIQDYRFTEFWLSRCQPLAAEWFA